MAASVGTATVKVNVEIGDDMEAAIRKIIRDEVETIAYEAWKRQDGGTGEDALAGLVVTAHVG